MLFAVLPGFGFLIWNENKNRQIQDRLGKIREQGMPTTFSELSDYYALPSDDKDTTQLWLDGVKPLLDKSAKPAPTIPILGQAKLPPLGQPWPDMEHSEAFLLKHAESLEKFHTAASLGGAARFSKYNGDMNKDLTAIHNQRQAARVLMLDAMVQAHRGNARQCAKSMDSLFAVERSLRDAPYLVSYLVQVATRSMAIDSLAKTIGGVPFTDEELKGFQSKIRSWNGNDELHKALVAERVMGCEILRGNAPGKMSLSKTPFMKFDLALYLEVQDDIQSAVSAGFPDTLAKVNAVQAKLVNRSGISKVTQPLTPQIVPPTVAACEATARVLSHGRAGETAITVVLFHRRTGKLPDSLTQLMPEFIADLPIDAFDGQPLRYRQVSNGFVVYSIGRDLKDQGGDPDQDPAVDDVFYVQMLP
jgi:hypothetical protein